MSPISPSPSEASIGARASKQRLSLWTGLASASLVALIFLCLLWELRLAPVVPGGSWLALKALPLLLLLGGFLKGRRKTYQVASLLLLFYLMEGLVRATSDPGALSRGLATAEVALSLSCFACVLVYARLTRHSAASMMR